MRTPETVQRKLDAFNRHDTEGFVACYAADAAIIDPFYDEPLKGADAIREDIDGWFAAFPDAECRLDHSLAVGSRHAGEWTASGTHKGPLIGPEGDIPATGNSVSIRLATFEEMDAEGRITEERRYYDGLSVLSQLGVTV